MADTYKSYCLHCRDQGIDNPATEMVGPYSLCADHADDEKIARARNRDRYDRWSQSDEGRRVIAAECRAEQRLEGRFS